MFSDFGLTKDSRNCELLEVAKKLKTERDSAAKVLSEVGMKKIGEVKTKIVSLNDQIAVLEAEKAVEKAMTDRPGKITEAMREWAVDFAKKDLKGFNDFVVNAPVSFTDMKRETPKPTVKKPQYTEEQLRFAKAFGHNPDEVYK
jgi:phage I-like protein